MPARRSFAADADYWVVKRHVLILEGALTGHHSVYLERIAGALLDDGDQVTVSVVRRDVQHESLRRLKEKFAGLRVHAMDDSEFDAAFRGGLGEFGRELRLRSVFSRVFEAVNKSHAVDHVLFPYLDYCLYANSLLGSPFRKVAWSGVCMRPSFHYESQGVSAPKPRFAAVKEWLFFRLLKSRWLGTIFTIDELLSRYAKESRPKLAGKVVYVPDPAELTGTHDQSSARVGLALPAGVKVVLCYGAIDSRKGLDALIAAAIELPSLHLLVVGRQSPWARELFASSTASRLLTESRLHAIDDFVSNDLQQMVFAAADAVWLGYREHYTMSGVLVLASLAGKPVIATNEGLIGWYTKRYGLGVCVSVTDNAEVKIGIDQLLDSRVGQYLEGGMKLRGHTWQNFLSLLRAGLK